MIKVDIGMTIKRTLFVAGLLLPILSAPLLARPLDPKVSAFAQDAALSNEFEVAESQMALEKSADPAVRAFARRMIRDHGMAQMNLHRAAMPTGSDTSIMFDPARQAKLDALSAASGPDFDKAYWADQSDAHAAAEAELGDFAMSGDDPALRHYARATLPVVQHHAAMVQMSSGM